jgi:hypothetical protein
VSSASKRQVPPLVNAQVYDLGIHASVVCESLLLPLRKESRIGLAPHERTMSAQVADERAFAPTHEPAVVCMVNPATRPAGPYSVQVRSLAGS